MRRSFFVVIFCLLAWLCASQGLAQTLTLHARTNLVPVPTLVESKTGGPVFGLTVKDFIVKDNGVEQKNIHLDMETDKTPISLVVLLQVGRAAVNEFYKMRGLPTMLDALPGDTPHRIAVVEFDSRPRLLQDFTSDDQQVSGAFQSIRPGDGGAAILDAVWYAVDMLQDEPQQDQRAILLISETRDHGSRTPPQALVHKIGASNAIVYTLTFSPARTEVLNDLKHGGGKGLLEPFIFAVQAIRKNAAAAIPQMTGGEYLRFNNGKGLDRKMALLTNQIHNRYMLSFQPADPKPGLHLLSVTLRQDIGAKVLARANYWADAPSAQTPAAAPEMPPAGGQP
jgi:VWFA-related protein